MIIKTAAELAEVLDPEYRENTWWKAHPSIWNSEKIYVGPSDLHANRKYAYLMEEWLESRAYSYLRKSHHDGFRFTVVRDENLDTIANNANHNAALVAAIGEINANAI